MFRSVETFLKPKAIAIVGASETSGGGWAKGLFENFAHEGFPAQVYLINPRRSELWGQKVYANFSSIPETVDLGIFIIPAEAVADVLTEAADAGLKNALIFASRFGEGGDEAGLARAQILKDICIRTGLRISGPNCMGAISLPERLLFYPTPRVRGLPKGPVGVVFQSGGTFQFWLEQGAARGLGYSYAISSGNELDLDMADYLNFLVEDEDTKVIVCMAEGVRRPYALMQAAKRAFDAGKPVLMLKVGRTPAGQEAARSHTGALATEEHIFTAMCHKYAITLVNTLDDLIEVSLVLTTGRLSKGNRTAFLGYSGGAKGLFMDIAQTHGLDLPDFSPSTKSKLGDLIDQGMHPSNPLDTGAGLARRFDLFSEICKIAAADPNIDMVSVQGQLPLSAGDSGDPKLFRNIMEGTEKPVIAHNRMSQNVNATGRAFQNQAGVPFLQRLPQVAYALSALARYSGLRNRGIVTEGSSSCLYEPGATINKVLSDNGISSPTQAVVKDVSEVGNVAVKVGFPVAVKVILPPALHKTELGGVELNIQSAEAAIQSANRIKKKIGTAAPDLIISGFQIQRMVSGLEVIVGVRDDPRFGPFFVLGLGGVLVEAVRDVAFRLLPLTIEDVRDMINELRGNVLLGQYRGSPPRDVEALIQAAINLSNVYQRMRGDITDIEINPLMVGASGEGVCAIDIRTIARQK